MAGVVELVAVIVIVAFSLGGVFAVILIVAAGIHAEENVARKRRSTTLHDQSRPECGGGDCEEECLLFRRARPDQQDFRATKMRQSETSKRKGLFQRSRWQMNAA